MKLLTWVGRFVASLLVGSLLASCNPAPLLAPTSTLMPTAALPTRPPTVEPEPVLPPTASVLPPRTTPTPTPTPTQTAPTYPTSPAPGMRAGDAELLFAAPVPSAAEIMEWRPPCVPVPHALHPNDHYWLRRPIPSGHVDWGLDWYPYGSNGFGTWRVHHGMDFPNDPGTPVLAAGDGVIIWVTDDWGPIHTEVEEPDDDMDDQPSDQPVPSAEAQPQDPEPTDSKEPEDDATIRERVPGSYGNVVIIRHDWGYQGQPVYTLYAHLLEVFVKVGDRVAAGDLIAGVGNTGNSSGPHLHLEVRVGMNDYEHTRDPALWIAPYEAWGTLAGRVTTAKGAFVENATVTVRPIPSGRDVGLDDSDVRILTTHASNQVNPDDLWGENFVVPDLPAGPYQVVAQAIGETLRAEVHIRAGVTAFVWLHSVQTPTPTPTPTPAPTPSPTPNSQP